MKRKNFIFLTLTFCLTIFCGAAAAQTGKAKSVKVKIYLLDNFESENLLGNLKLIAVEREVNAESPLRFALEAQLAGATKDETAQLMYSPVSGIKLVSMRVKNKTAYARFTRNSAEKPETIDALRFKNAVTKTALQFSSIRKIEICLDGVADFWVENKISPKKCQ